MTPEETPDLHFLADSRSLRQAITSFGCISAQVNTAHLPAAGTILWLRPLPDCLSVCLQLVEGVSSPKAAHHASQMQSCPLVAKKQVNCSPGFFITSYQKVILGSLLTLWCLFLFVQKMEDGTLKQWLLGSHVSSLPETGFQSSSTTEDWLLSPKENQVTQMFQI